MTKTEQRMWNNYKNSNAFNLSDVYTKFSNAKRRAFNDCMEMCHNHDGYGLKICTHNAQMFTAAFKFIRDDQLWLCYITPTQTHEFIVHSLDDLRG